MQNMKRNTPNRTRTADRLAQQVFAVILLAGAFLQTPLIATASEAADTKTWTTALQWGGTGGVYFLASPGDFWVDIEKRDLNISGLPTHLRAILFGPDRRVIEEHSLSDDGQAKGSGMGPIQRVRMATQVTRKGIYGLSITLSNDRYGEDILWGIRTNCPKYLVETSRGHRDAPHEEPLVLMSPESPGDVCFLPRGGECVVDLADLPPQSGPVEVYDAANRKVAEMRPSADGKTSAGFQTGPVSPTAPWRLHFPRFKGVVRIDDVTRWAETEKSANLSLWTPSRESWFPFAPYRWLLTPYSRTIYAKPGDEATASFEIHNNGSAETRVALSLEFPDGPAWPVELPEREVLLAPHASAQVAVRCHAPLEGQSRLCYLRATPSAYPELTTFSTLEVRGGTAPAERPLTLPIVLKPYTHENELFGYLPQYPLDNQVYFDLQNRPFVRTEKGVSVWRDGKWTETEAASARLLSTKIAFDADNGVYLLAAQDDAPLLQYSADGRKSFTPCPIPGKGTCDIEQFSGHNAPQGPPPLVRYTLTAKDPKLMWRRLCDLALVLPKKDPQGGLSIPEPVMLSRKCLGFSGHSGMPSSVVSRGSRVHVVWAEATEPEEKAPGVPTFAVTYDRDSGALSAPALIGYGPPANDVHNTPSITIDSQGYLHALVGSHGRTFKYARSLQPNDAAGGWTPAEDVGPGVRQTYVGMVCGRDDVLHLVCRLWRDDTAYFPAGYYAPLAYMCKRPGEPWSAPRPLVMPPFSEYSVYYHRLTIDRTGRLFVSYDYWSTYWFYRNDHRGTRRALLTSPDGGVTWKLAENADLAH